MEKLNVSIFAADFHKYLIVLLILSLGETDHKVARSK